MKKIKFSIKDVLLAFIPVIVCAVLGSIFMLLKKVDYESLKQPFLAPPKIVFPIAWTILYVLIAISGYLYLIKCENKEEKMKGLIVYYIGLFLNAFWTLFYFTLDLKVFAAIWLGALYIVSASNYVIFNKKNKTSGYLLIPYLIWLLFALYLNIGTAILN